MRMYSLAAFAAALIALPICAQDKGAKKTPLDIAKELASSKFKDATYGADSKKGQVNDATFVVAVLEGCGAKLTADAKDAILGIGKTGADPKTAQAAVEKNDATLAGVQNVLVNQLKVAKKIELRDVQVGDFVQYWKLNDKKEWYGYAFVVETVEKDAKGENPKVKLYGAHEGKAAMGKGGGNPLGTSSFDLTLKEDSDRKIFLARLNEIVAAEKAKEPPKKEPAKKDPPKKDPLPPKKK